MNTDNELPEIAPQTLPDGASEIEPAAIETLAAVVAESQAAVLAEIPVQGVIGDQILTVTVVVANEIAASGERSS